MHDLCLIWDTMNSEAQFNFKLPLSLNLPLFTYTLDCSVF